MEGILYITDERTKKSFVQIDLDLYGGEYLQDLIDGLVAESRKDDKSIPLDEVLKELRETGKIEDVKN